MRSKVTAAFAAATMIFAPVAASANPASALSVASTAQATDAEGAESSGGIGTGTIVGVLFALAALTVGFVAGGSDSPDSP